MRVLVTGASGFVGGYVCAALLAAGHQVTGLQHRKNPDGTNAPSATGDVVTGEGLNDALKGQDAVVHLVGIIRQRRGSTFEAVHVQGTGNVVAAAEAAGVPRLIHVSALGADPRSASAYQSSKGRAEELVRASHLAWTILRPSLMFGVGDDFFGVVLRNLVLQPPLIPVVGTGAYPFRPVWVQDVASAVERALTRPASAGRSFDLVGPEEYTLRQLLLQVRQVLGVRKPLVNVPLPLMRLATALFRLLPNPPISRDQLLMLVAGNTGDPAPALNALGLDLTHLEEQLPQILRGAWRAGRRR